MDKPLVSVIMSVYNTKEEYLRESIESILNQSYEFFEFIIIDDASDRWCSMILEEYIDKRIKLLKNKVNLGLTKSLNKALDISKGQYIARMDSDDVAYPNRLERQVEYMEQHLNIAALGTLAKTSDTNECIGHLKTRNKELLKVYMLFQNAGIMHPTAMLRKSFLDEHSIKYREQILKAQDYALWLDILQHGKIQCLNQVLLVYRRHKEQITQNMAQEQIKYTNIIMDMQLRKMDLRLTDKELEMFGSFRFQKNIGTLEQMYELLKKIEKFNSEKPVYNKRYLQRELLYIWFLINKKDVNIWKYLWTYKIFAIWNVVYIIKMVIMPYKNKGVYLLRCKDTFG